MTQRYEVTQEDGTQRSVVADTYDHARRVASRQARQSGADERVSRVRLVGPEELPADGRRR